MVHKPTPEKEAAMALMIPLNDAPYLMTTETHPELYETSGSLTLEAMQQMVGGYIEHVFLHPTPRLRLTLDTSNDLRGVLEGAPPNATDVPDDFLPYVHLVINEEGKLNGLAINPIASALVQRHGLRGDVICGPALFLGQDEMQ